MHARSQRSHDLFEAEIGVLRAELDAKTGLQLPDAPKGAPKCKGSRFEVGDLVRPHSLSTESLNGMVGCVRGFVGERAQVEFIEVDGFKLIRPSNLVADDDEDEYDMCAVGHPCGPILQVNLPISGTTSAY